MSTAWSRWAHRFLPGIAKFALGALLLSILWRKGLVDPERIAAAFSTHPRSMAAALGLHGLVFILLALRWRLFARAGRILLPVALSTRLTLTSHFFSTCLPGNGAGDLVKAWILSRRGIDFPAALGTIVLDRFVGMAGLFATWALFLAAALAVHPASTPLLVPFLVLAAFGSAAFLGAVFFSRRILSALGHPFFLAGPRRARLAGAVRRTLEPVAAGSGSPRALVAGLGLSVANQVCQIGTAWLAGRILSIPADLVACGAVLPLVSLVNALPLSPGGLGVGETTGAAAMREFGLAPDAGGQIVLVVRIASVFWALAGSLAYLSLRQGRNGNSGPQG